jgi:outer membrane receptor protein involved in Fe transport
MAQGGSGQTGSQANPAQPAQQLPTTSVTVTVVGTTPLVGVELPREQIPAPVQTVSARELRTSGALDLTDLLNRRLSGVHVNETQGNPFQPDVNYRGYTASPLLGTPQGLSVYMDGVRLNEPFGEIVSWDLIPRTAIFSSALMPGSNPLFGLNTLGGALALQTKDGRNSPGTSIQATYGSDLRRAVEFEHGGARGATGLDWYVAGHVFAEDGWREDSPSTVRQLFGKLGWREEGRDLRLSLSHTDNALYGNGLQESRWLERDYASAYTKPDITDNRSTLLNFLARHDVNERLTFSANLYYRNIDADTLNGDINEESLGQSIYQPNEEELAALAGAGFLGVPDSGATASNTPFPSWRCIANVLLNDEPGERCNGLINRTDSQQHNAGASGQVTRRHAVGRGGNQITVGASYDRSTVGFSQSTEIGHLAPDRSVIGTGAFADGITGGFLDDEPFDARVRLNGVVQTWSAFATDTISLGTAWHVTLSGRFNRTSVTNRDRIDPGGGPGSLDGHHVFSRFNPAAGVTFSPSRSVNLYAGYNEGSRAATSIELGCADPEQPCRLPNAMASDPGLDPVITRTVEAGLRGWHRGVSWRAGLFRAVNSDDILFVTSEQTGFGYFRNFGETRRQGLELGATAQMRRLQLGVGYTFLDATFQSEETVNGDSNSTNDAAREGNPGLEGAIQIEPGHRMPFAPRHTLKIFAEVQVTGDLVVDADLTGASRSYARGNENNQHEPDGIYYLGPGGAPGYAVVNLGARYRLTRRLELLGQIGNLLDRRYFTAAQLGPLGFTDTGAFIARPLPETDGEFPLRHATFYAPGAPIRAWIGTRVTF